MITAHGMKIQSLMVTPDIHQPLRNTNRTTSLKISVQSLEIQLQVTARADSLPPSKDRLNISMHNGEPLLFMAASTTTPTQNLEEDRVSESSSLQAYCCLKQQLCAFMQYLWPSVKHEEEWRE